MPLPFTQEDFLVQIDLQSPILTPLALILMGSLPIQGRFWFYTIDIQQPSRVGMRIGPGIGMYGENKTLHSENQSHR